MNAFDKHFWRTGSVHSGHCIQRSCPEQWLVHGCVYFVEYESEHVIFVCHIPNPPFYKFQFKEFLVECRVGVRQDPLSHYGNLLGQTLFLSALHTHLPSTSQWQVHDKLGWPTPPLGRWTPLSSPWPRHRSQAHKSAHLLAQFPWLSSISQLQLGLRDACHPAPISEWNTYHSAYCNSPWPSLPASSLICPTVNFPASV